jgi:hypothetical protein
MLDSNQRMENQHRELMAHKNRPDDASDTATISYNENPSTPASPDLRESDSSDNVGASSLASSYASIMTASSARTS